MPSKGGYAAPPGPPPRNTRDRFYNAVVRRHQQQQQHAMFQQQMMQMQLLQQQQQQHQHQHEFQLRERRMHQRQGVEKAESSSDKQRGEDQGDGSSKKDVVALVVPPSVGGYNTKLTNLDRLMKSLTPCIPVQYLSSETNSRGRKMREVETQPFFFLEALWESFYEWSVYGAGVPFLLNGTDPVEQYYVPYLSGIQLYMDPSNASSQLKMINEDAESCTLNSSVGNNAPDPGRKSTSIVDLNTRRLDMLSLGHKPSMNSPSFEPGVADFSGPPMFQFLEHEQPHTRRPLADKISVLTSQHPELSNCRSCDLLPSSWICVAWYPIYRIPVGSTLKDVDACFLTFHSLSTQSKSCSKTQILTQNARKIHDNVDPAANISLPVFALASYKLKDSIVSPNIPREWEQEKSLLKAADEWLKQLQVNLPDYQFFRSQPPYRR